MSLLSDKQVILYLTTKRLDKIVIQCVLDGLRTDFQTRSIAKMTKQIMCQ